MTYSDFDRWCQGSCMQGARRKVRNYENAQAAYLAGMDVWRIPLVVPDPPAEPRIGFAVYGDPVFDSSCTYDIKAKLSRLDGMACIYAREADGHRGANSEARVSGSSERASLSPTVEDLDELDDWFRAWKATYLGVDTFARQGSLADSLTLGCAWLVGRAERVLARPDVAKAFGDEVVSWYSRLARFDPSDVVIHRKPLRCDWCRGLTLEWRQGDDRVKCRLDDCGRILLVGEYEALVEEETKAHRRPARSAIMTAS